MKREGLLTVVVCFLAVLVLSCSSMGTRLEYGGSELYYTKNVTEAEAKKLGDYLFKGGVFSDENKGTVQLDKSGDTYLVRMVVKEGMDKDENYQKLIPPFAKGVSKNVFNGAKVEVQLCDDKLNTLKTIPMSD